MVSRPSPTRVRRFLTAIVSAVGLLALVPSLVSAQTIDTPSIALELASSGRYLEFSADSSLEAEIDNANNEGIAFVWLDSDAEGALPEQWAQDLALKLDSDGSTLHTVAILTNRSISAYSTVYSSATINNAVNESLPTFGSGDQAGGLARFSNGLNGSSSTPSSGSSSSGFWQFLLAMLGLGGVVVFYKSWRAKRNRKEQDKAELAADIAEVQEQLKANADKVINLGDQVIISGDSELIELYDEASKTYQHVSHAIELADDADEVDRIDDQMDEAEWQLEVIEARLAGRTPPPSPAQVEAKAKAKAEAERAAKNKPALGANDSVLTPNSNRSNRYPPTYYPYPAPRRRSRGGGFLGGLILGSTMGRSNRSRNRRPPSRRRGGGGGGSFGGGGGGSFGGGGGGGSF